MLLNILSLVVGVAGGAAGVWAAIWVYRRQRADTANTRALDQRREKDSAKEAEQRRAEDLAREEANRAREVRRLKHQDDYRAINNLLERAGEASEQVRVDRVWTRGKAETSHLWELYQDLGKYAARVPELQIALWEVEDGMYKLHSNAIPDDSPDPAVLLTLKIIRQIEAQAALDRAVKKARATLDQEWER